MSEWQPIETAPKDGTWILVTGGQSDYSFPPDGLEPHCYIAQWATYLNGCTVSGHWQCAWYDGGYYGYYENPTHWMPLPSSPEDRT